eukprot:552020-Amphidinium_carterae.1
MVVVISEDGHPSPPQENTQKLVKVLLAVALSLLSGALRSPLRLCYKGFVTAAVLVKTGVERAVDQRNNAGFNTTVVKVVRVVRPFYHILAGFTNELPPFAGVKLSQWAIGTPAPLVSRPYKRESTFTVIGDSCFQLCDI